MVGLVIRTVPRGLESWRSSSNVERERLPVRLVRERARWPKARDAGFYLGQQPVGGWLAAAE